ncbi:hypothetical protein ACX1DX_03590 [Tessaracoccus sp. Y36]|uniref:Uncharacterized protein n=1 Tax=Microbacterium ginsengisoli TaxID=400772 RepID=A0A0F0LVV1_9MICO|nr:MULTISPECIES: hypothetical protein [Actinomycetes]KJL36430.1 hypothetical protein RR49_01766 [Microbacterium ginsengisoli]MDI9960442.1 hypothetical protein [Rhodococcus sp. IEGM 1237]MDI9966306.1 hypothetical protein [Rhodococcus sp. IEGM 1251]MDV8128642.1 hypothetical protein [Rhodococcus sp. IEGM 1304]MEE1622464.1 hypothetical protein [Zafaria sp. J156]
MNNENPWNDDRSMTTEHTSAIKRNEPTKNPAEDLTPDAIEAEATRQQAMQLAQEQHRARGVDWVRPTDLMARHSATVARRGIDFHANLARQTRTGIANASTKIGKRIGQLPPLSAFGRRSSSREPVTRGSVGKS